MDKEVLLKGIKDFLLIGVVLGAVLYSATTAWKNGEKLTGLESEMKGVKESLIALVLDDRPNKTDLATRLLSDVSVIEGLDEFKEQNYHSAFSLWSEAALKGDESSAFAIYAAKIKLNDEIKVLPVGEERENLLKAVSFAPEVVKEGNTYILSAQEKK